MYINKKSDSILPHSECNPSNNNINYKSTGPSVWVYNIIPTYTGRMQGC